MNSETFDAGATVLGVATAARKERTMDLHPVGRAVKAMAQRVSSMTLLSLALTGCVGGAASPPAPSLDSPPAMAFLDPQRGQLLYDAQCVTCHTTQAHWRDNSIVGSWSDVLAQVDRWQLNTGQHWGTSEIGDVAAYLNSVYYKMPCPAPGCRGNSTASLTLDTGAARVE